jgi:diguanylate cyclase (GGDEF)-like protein/PAS domain S-box-containing protein
MTAPNAFDPQLTEQLGDVYFFRDLASGQIIYISPRYEQQFHRQRDHAYQDQQDWLLALHAEDRPLVYQRLTQHRQARTPYQDEYRIIWPDGTLHRVLQRSWLAEFADQRSCYVSVVQPLLGSSRLSTTGALPSSSDTAQARLSSLLESPVAVVVRMRVYGDQHWEWDYFSAGCERLFGFSVEELAGDPHLWISRVHPDDVKNVIEPLFVDIFAESDFVSHEYRFFKKNGELRWMQGNLSSRYDPPGNLWVVTIVATDITPQKQAEASLRASQSLLQRVTDDLPQILYIFDLRTCRNEYINLCIQTVLGVHPADIQQASLMEDFFHPEEQQALADHFQSWRNIPDGIPQEVEYRMRHRDGHWRWLKSREVVFERDDQGQPIKLLGTAVDVTDEKQAEADLKAVLRSISVCIGRFRVLPDGDFQYDYISPASFSLWGYAPEAIIDTPSLWSDNVHPDDWETQILPLHQCIYANQESHLEYRFRHPTQGWRWIAVNLTVEENPPEQHWIVTTVSWDVSDRKHLETALQRQTQLERLLHRITVDMHQTLDLERILATAVNDVRQSFSADRALIFQLLTDGSGQVIQESVVPEYPITDQMRWLDEDFPHDCYEHYRQGLPRIVPDIATDAWADCLVEFMQEVGVKSKVVAPIVQKAPQGQNRVWGLLIIHACADQRQWQPLEAQTLQQIADQLAIAIQQASLYEQLQAANQQLSHLATTDSLTQLANRRAFDTYLQQEWARMVREQQELSLIICDIDHFKLYNDTFGHPQGDTCLMQVAAVIREVVKRPGDFIARYGGEEFVVILPQTSGDGAIRVVQTMQGALSQRPIPHQASPLGRRITLSFGIASGYPARIGAAERMLEAADQALYEAKSSGRNCYRIQGLEP